jgi:hypothetical protein
MQRFGPFALAAVWVGGAQLAFWLGWVADRWLPTIVGLSTLAGWILIDQTGPGPAPALRTESRFAALVAAVLAFVVGTAALVIAALSLTAFQRPDPDPALDGDPCCWHPDTWTDVAVGGGFFAVVAFVAFAFLGASGLLVASAVLGRFPASLRGRGRMIRRLAIAAAVGAVAIPTSWIVQSTLFT